jgi:transcription antitermination factor NusG
MDAFENLGGTCLEAEGNQPPWYALYVRCNQEKLVACGLAGRGIEFFLPCYESVRQWKDRRVKLKMPLFPGYVFVRGPLMERNLVLTVPNVVHLVGTSQGPSPILEREIRWVREGLEHGCAQPHEYLKEGQRVLITEGVMSGLEGIMISRRNRSRIVVALDSILRAFVIEVEASQVKVVPARREDRPVALTAAPPWRRSQANTNPKPCTFSPAHIRT